MTMLPVIPVRTTLKLENATNMGADGYEDNWVFTQG